MKRILLAGATLLALTAAQPTLAADAPVYKGPPPLAAALFNWSGFYVGLQAGYGWGQSEQYSTVVVASTGKYNISGFAGGGTLGWNWQTGGLVLGLETDISWANITGATSDSATWACAVANGCVSTVQWFGTARGRVGFTTGPMLAYVTAGLAYGAVNVQIVGFNNGTVSRTGWTGGGGLEWLFAPNWSGKIEYLYVDFGDFQWTTFGATPGLSNARFSVVRAGLNWHF